MFHDKLHIMCFNLILLSILTIDRIKEIKFVKEQNTQLIVN